MDSINSNAVDDYAENIVSDMDSIHSINGGSDSPDIEEEDLNGDSESAASGLLDDTSSAGVDVMKAGVDGRKTGVDATNTGLDESKEGVTEVAAVNEAVDVDNDRGVKPCGAPSLRPRGAKKDPTHILGGYGQNDFLFAFMDADAQFSFLTEQMSLKRGLKHFKKKGLEALMVEMSQLHYRKTITPVFADSQ
jgi:hypothetical protein